jgi:pyridoxamine 5'-phosphate oxidase
MKDQLETPEGIRQRIWMELGRAALDRHHEWRTPVLATLGRSGTPNARTVVLRKTDAAAQSFDFYTDSGSPKVTELIAQPYATLLFWSTRLNWQLRARVTIIVDTSGEQVEAVWAKVKQSRAAGDYLTVAAPGDKLSAAGSAAANAHADSSDDSYADANANGQLTHHLAILNARVDEIDWLELSRNGHRRARLSSVDWEWLTP